MAEIRPVEPTTGETWAGRLTDLERRGNVQRFPGSPRQVELIARRKDALRRFLEERDG